MSLGPGFPTYGTKTLPCDRCHGQLYLDEEVYATLVCYQCGDRTQIAGFEGEKLRLSPLVGHPEYRDALLRAARTLYVRARLNPDTIRLKTSTTRPLDPRSTAARRLEG